MRHPLDRKGVSAADSSGTLYVLIVLDGDVPHGSFRIHPLGLYLVRDCIHLYCLPKQAEPRFLRRIFMNSLGDPLTDYVRAATFLEWSNIRQLQ